MTRHRNPKDKKKSIKGKRNIAKQIDPEIRILRIYDDDRKIYNTLIKLWARPRKSFSIRNVVVYISPGEWMDPETGNMGIMFHIRHRKMGEEKGFFLLATCTGSRLIDDLNTCVGGTQIQVECMHHHVDKLDSTLECIFKDLGISLNHPVLLEDTSSGEMI